MSHTKKNLRKVEDSALSYGLSETQEARFARRDLAAEQTGLTYLIVKPGCREAFAHRHRAVRVGPGTTRQFEAGAEGLELLIVGAHVAGDVEQVPDFWPR